jgi:valyl-tRNA synthetase
MATETQDIRMPVVKDPKTGTNTSPKFDIGRNFANKIWNASRYVLSNVDEKTSSQFKAGDLNALEDRWIVSRLNSTIQTVTASINAYKFAELAESLRSFFWTDLCDWYLEIAKARTKGGDSLVQSILLHCLETTLKLLHPVMPFITEEIWSKLPNRSSMLIKAAFPVVDASRIDAAAESQIGLIQSITSAIREIQNRYPAAKGKDVVLQPRDAQVQATIEKSRSIIESLAAAKIAENAPGAKKPENAATAVLPEVQIFIAGVIDKAVEKPKLEKRRDELTKLATSQRNKLGNEAAIAKVPAAVVQGWRDQLTKYEEELRAIETNLQELGA